MSVVETGSMLWGPVVLVLSVVSWLGCLVLGIRLYPAVRISCLVLGGYLVLSVVRLVCSLVGVWSVLISSSVRLVWVSLVWVWWTFLVLIGLLAVCRLVALIRASLVVLSWIVVLSMLWAAFGTVAMTVCLWLVSVPSRSDPLVPGWLMTMMRRLLCRCRLWCVLVSSVLRLVCSVCSTCSILLLVRKLTLLLGKLTVVLMHTCNCISVLNSVLMCVEKVLLSECSVVWVRVRSLVVTRLVIVLVRIRLSPLPKKVCLSNLLGWVRWVLSVM